MTEPSITLSFPPRVAERQFDIDTATIRRIASLILRKSNPHCNGWTRDNLIRRLSKLTPQRACLLILFVTSSLSDNSLEVCFDLNSRMPLVDLLSYLCREEFCPTFLFLVTENGVTSEISSAIDTLNSRQFVSWTPAEHYREMVALGCEFSRWWGLRSLMRPDVDYQYLADRLAVLIARLNEIGAREPFISFKNHMNSRQIAWSDGLNLMRDVDCEKFTSAESREEQYSDSLKHLADAAYAPRIHHQTFEDHLVSSQALFWFAELPQHRIDFDWLSSTRFAFELFGETHQRSTAWTVEAIENLQIDQAKTFLTEFVSIPKGNYRLGSKDHSTSSEPPAGTIEVFVPEFRMLKRPIVGRDWRLFSRTDLGRLKDELPVTHCNAFQAFSYANQVERVLKERGLIGSGARVNLPSERQWEVAARGAAALEYPWGNSFELGRCNCDLLSGPAPTKPGLFSPQGDSPFGCQDMAGNVREWTRSYGGVSGIDWQTHGEPEILRTSASLQPADRLIVRGGSYFYDADCVRTWVRNTQLAERSDQQTGFRLVIEGDK